MTQRVTLATSGHCCVCAGICHHVGGPRFCADHSGPRPLSSQWTETVEPGTAELVQHDDGTVTVRHADPTIIVSPAVIEELQSKDSAHLEADGTLVLDTAGEYRYQRVGERNVHGRTELIYRRVHKAAPLAGTSATHDGPRRACSSPLCEGVQPDVRR